jgi:hypothetical protein
MLSWKDIKEHNMDNNIALTDLVRSLGFKDHTKLANAIRDILKVKENFDKYIIGNDETNINRIEKTIVSKESKILVDNLAILLQFPRLFGKAQKDDIGYLPSYRELKKGVNKDAFNQNVLAQIDLHQRKIDLSKKSLKDLPTFANAISENGRIDITTQSIRELMSNNREILDLGNSFQLAAWNELLALQEKVEQGEHNTTLYQQIGEKLLELGESELALEALNSSVELDPDNGISWAIISKILYPKLQYHKTENYQAMARTEFSGYIEHPINSEEHWINERVEESFDSVTSVKDSLIHAAINALSNWPHWEEAPRNHGKAKGEKNYYYRLNQSHNTSVDLTREELFYILINEISYNHFNINKELFIDIFRSFQSWNKELYPLTNTECFYKSLSLQEKLLVIISWISADDAKLAIEACVRNWTYMPHSATKSLILLKQYSVSQLCWQHLGQDRFNTLFETLESFEVHNMAHEKLSVITRLRLNDLTHVLQPIAQRINILERENSSLNYWDQKKVIELNSSDCDELNATVKSSLVYTHNWHEYLENDLWKKSPFSHELPRELLTYILLASLIEIANGEITEANINILIGFNEHKNTLKTALILLNSTFFDVLIQQIIARIIQKNKQNVVGILEKMAEMREEIHQDDLNDSMDFF